VQVDAWEVGRWAAGRRKSSGAAAAGWRTARRDQSAAEETLFCDASVFLNQKSNSKEVRKKERKEKKS
jgi:hypothetical protein